MSLNEKLIAFQNRAESDYKEAPGFKNTLRYILAFVLFMGSTVLAALLLPYHKLKGMLKKSAEIGTRGVVNVVTDTNVTAVFESHPLIVLDFWAVWCGPCIMMEPLLTKFAENNPDVFVGKVDADRNTALVKKFRIKGLPQIILIKNGEEIKRHAGPLTQRELADFVKG